MMEMREAAVVFLRTLSEDDRQRIKNMLLHGIVCGADFARENELNPMQFADELRLVFGGK